MIQQRLFHRSTHNDRPFFRQHKHWYAVCQCRTSFIWAGMYSKVSRTSSLPIRLRLPPHCGQICSSGSRSWMRFSVFSGFSSFHYSCQLRFRISCAVRGHWNPPCSIRLYNNTKPSPSHRRALILSRCLPKNRNRLLERGTSFEIFECFQRAPKTLDGDSRVEDILPWKMGMCKTWFRWAVTNNGQITVRNRVLGQKSTKRKARESHFIAYCRAFLKCTIGDSNPGPTD